MIFSGELFTYNDEKRLTAFESGRCSSSGFFNKVVVFISGLGDGFNAVPFLEPLSEMLFKNQWGLVQAQLSSSYQGFGTSNLQTDSEELDSLVSHLKNQRHKDSIVFLGHSTGSQDCYWHNKNGKHNQHVNGYILQAPVSDRQYFEANLENFRAYVEMATQLSQKENKGEELMPRKALDGVPITANRFFSLTAVGGDDDVFSTDFTKERIAQLYENVKRPICWVYSENDEYYVPTSEASQSDVMKRYQDVCPAIKETHIIAKGDHSITLKESQTQFCQVVETFLKRLDSYA
ncbi:hypothetical protein BDF20DRAFT_888456 [Mycotypha africana]|uniref:uncharacterized protein n=1 Tax=Mycotypha africana TaxID=64632 RepID=UPI0022FFF9F6|nr:uncharacterized protein BDF20DRAFT_888456 [Mycotypha africana]KAI8969924.1 hypothetical protein BDF20DRAFT_888456 [Mycotypha africana]